MPLYGHELSESIDPFTAGLDFAVQFGRPRFPRPRCAGPHRQPSRAQRVRVGLELAGKRVPREGYAIHRGPAVPAGTAIGEVTSGTFSPTLETPIAMGYVQVDAAEPGTELAIDIRGQSSRPASCRCRFIAGRNEHE